MGYRLLIGFLGLIWGLDFSVAGLVSQCSSLTIGDLYTTNLTKNQYKIGVRDENYARYNWRWRKVGAEEWETFTNTVPYYFIDVKPTKRYEFQCKAGCQNGEEGDWSPRMEFINDCENFSGSLNYIVLEDGIVVYLNAEGHFDGYDFYGVKIKDDVILANRNWGSDEPDFEIPLNTSQSNEIKFQLTCPNGQKTDYTDWYSIRAYCHPPSVNDIVAVPLGSSVLQVLCHRPSTQFEFRIRPLGESTWRNSGKQIIGLYVFDDINTDLSHEIQCRIACGTWSETAVYEGTCRAPEYADLKVEWPAFDKIKITDRGADDGVTAWEWRWRVLGSSGSWFGASTQVNSYTMRNLLPRTEYEVRVRRVCGQAEGEWLENVYISTSEFPCIPPVDGLDVEDIEFKSAYLFTYVDEFDRLQFRYRPKSGRPEWIETAETRQYRQRIDGLEYGTRYEFQGRIKCNGEYSEWADGPDFTTRDCFEPDPSHLLVLETTANSFTITYIGDYDYAIDWRYRETGSANWIKPDRNGLNEIFVYGLPQGKSYEVECRLVCGVVNGNNVWSNWVTAPSVVTQDCYPEISNIKEITTTSMKVVMPDGFEAYAVRYRETGTNNWSYTDYESSRRIVLDNLLPGTQYEMACSFRCSGLDSPYSESVFESTLAAAAAFRSSGPHESYLYAEILDAQRVELTVNVGGFSGYQFRVRSAEDLDWHELVATEEDHAIFPASWQEDCSSCNEYYFQARVLHAGNLTGINTRSEEWSPWSRESSFYPMRILNRLCPPLDSKRLAAAQIDQHSAILVCDLLELNRYFWRLKNGKDSIWTILPVSDVPYIKIDSLTESTIYEFQVAIPCQGQFGSWSASQFFQTRGTGNCAPPEYQNLYATRIDNHTAIIAYPLKESVPISWRFRLAGEGSWDYLPIHRATIRRLSGLKAGAVYELQARIHCEDSLVSLWSPYITFKTLPDCQSVPTAKIQVNEINDNSVIVGIVDSKAGSYAFRYRQAGHEEWVRFPLSLATEVVISNLEKNKDYEVQVYNKCSFSSGNWSDSQQFRLNTTAILSEQANIQYKVFPNPSQGQIYVDLRNHTGQWEVQIINVLGQTVQESRLTGGSLVSLDLPFSSNLYLLRLRQGEVEKTHKLIIR